jgi:hypothetical protein
VGVITAETPTVACQSGQLLQLEHKLTSVAVDGAVTGATDGAHTCLCSCRWSSSRCNRWSTHLPLQLPMEQFQMQQMESTLTSVAANGAVPVATDGAHTSVAADGAVPGATDGAHTYLCSCRCSSSSCNRWSTNLHLWLQMERFQVQQMEHILTSVAADVAVPVATDGAQTYICSCRWSGSRCNRWSTYLSL